MAVFSVTMLMNSFENYLIALTTPSSQAYFATMNYNAIGYNFIIGYGFSVKYKSHKPDPFLCLSIRS